MGKAFFQKALRPAQVALPNVSIQDHRERTRKLPNTSAHGRRSGRPNGMACKAAPATQSADRNRRPLANATDNAGSGAAFDGKCQIWGEPLLCPSWPPSPNKNRVHASTGLLTNPENERDRTHKAAPSSICLRPQSTEVVNRHADRENRNPTAPDSLHDRGPRNPRGHRAKIEGGLCQGAACSRTENGRGHKATRKPTPGDHKIPPPL